MPLLAFIIITLMPLILLLFQSFRRCHCRHYASHCHAFRHYAAIYADDFRHISLLISFTFSLLIIYAIY